MALKDDLIAYYKLDETSGTNADDAHSTHDGTANDARVFTTNTASGIINNDADFEQGDDYIDVGSLGTLGTSWGGGAGTVQFWVNTTTTSFEHLMGDVTDSGGDDPFFMISTNDRDTGGITFAVRDNSTSTRTTIIYATTNNLINDGSWHHVVIKWDDLDVESSIEIWVDGSDQATSTDGTAFDSASGLDDFSGFLLGARNNRGTPDSFFDGRLDEVGFWTREITDTEVGDLYNSGDGLSYDDFDAEEGTNMQINIGDAWKEVSAMKINIGDDWKEVAGAQINIGDSWKTIF